MSLYFVLWPVQAMCQQQNVCDALCGLFRFRPHARGELRPVANCTGSSPVSAPVHLLWNHEACHKAMLAEQRSSRGLRRWSRLGEHCTQKQCPRPPGAVLRPFPRPTRVIWCLVCLCWHSCDSGERRRGGGRGTAGPRHACLHLILMPVRPPPPYPGRPTQHTALPLHCARQAPTPTMVCRGGGGALGYAATTLCAPPG